ncbi:NAD(P)/FAD-dependent oxidoreductase [Sinomonas atrocyanea]|uniref:NAD(P)/FAD-dependent oxidoreductase n=1 Tax=Sinomonas atrocyanea TaxID=37927 RepID=UPI00278AC35F|nr:FAD-dependent oxidoreductase [Sinomonas atrocyanea]MDQ0261040.1 3-phenylpropionate/trans-cinnamate dioxygenase ferredoxin reductase subunit [Sinomonas atrocyanea]MDR6620366.1 3-phenylpropionate/trans-cinnamate dioxygenase ferredoxin reductase subunit [Sinomonas atrocyanea]
MAEKTGLLIIGASQSGVQLAISLRALGFEEPITLLGEENHRPYQRPALSKEWLQGEVGNESLIFRSNEYWDEHHVTLVKDQRITEIRKNPDGSGVAVAASGAEFPFQRLALTVGARARKLAIDGGELAGVVYLRNADDALALKAIVGTASDVVVVGGGFIGLEAASSLKKMGKNVVVLEAGPRLVGRAVGEETAQFFLDAHRARGLDIRLGAKITRFVPGSGEADSVAGAELAADGGAEPEVVPAQIVLVGIGVVPNTELAEQMGLAVDNGIVVDQYALASDGTTVAVGDCANMPNPVPGSPAGERIRLESVNNAIEHAKVAAYSLMGRREDYAGIPWFWSNQADLKLQIAGLSMGFDQTVVRRDDERGKFSVLYYRTGRIIAADCVNAPLDFMAVKNALAKGQNIPADAVQAAAPDVQLKTLAVPLAPAPA